MRRSSIMVTSSINEIAASRTTLLKALANTSDVTFVRLHGNVGDELIYAGTRQLLADIPYREIRIQDLKHTTGHTALLAGGGAWCGPYHFVPPYLSLLENLFERVIILPSSF